MIDIRLKTFITLAKIKSFTRTAEILNLTQPAVSQHVKYLEEYYGVNLIKKRGKEIDLTEEGKILFGYSLELDVLHRNLEAELRNKNSIHRTYSVGATMTIGGYVLPYILAEHKRSNKNIDIILEVKNTEDVIKKLLNRKLDLALVEGNFDKNRFNYRKFKDDEMVLTVSKDHYFAKKGKATLGEVLKGELILREEGSGTRDIFEKKLQGIGYDLSILKPYMELGSISAIKSLVEENLGYTIISRETIRRELKLGLVKVVPIEGLEIYREFNFVYLKESDNDFIDNFINFCVMNKQVKQMGMP